MSSRAMSLGYVSNAFCISCVVQAKTLEVVYCATPILSKNLLNEAIKATVMTVVSAAMYDTPPSALLCLFQILYSTSYLHLLLHYKHPLHILINNLNY